MEPDQKILWIKCRKLYAGITTAQEPKALCIPIDESSQRMELQLRSLLSIPDTTVIKMRNQQGSLIPITNRMLQNKRTEPYTLDAVYLHQHVGSVPRAASLETYRDMSREAVENISKRILRLEEEVERINDKRRVKIDLEVAALSKQLEFLTKRMSDAETQNWQGMFNKNPLW